MKTNDEIQTSETLAAAVQSLPGASTPPSGADVSAAAADGDGEAIDFSSLPPGMMLTKKSLARMLACTVRGIERAEATGALPCSILWRGRRWWKAGTVQEYLERLDRQAQADAARLASRV